MRLIAICPIFVLALAYVPTVAGAPCKTLEECIAKGVELMRLIKDAGSDKVGLPEKYAKEYKGLEDLENIGSNDNRWKMTDVMHGLPLAIRPTLTKVVIEGVADTAYENLYGEGIIVALYNYNIYDPVPQLKRVNWDVIAFEQYHRSAHKDPEDLTYILRHTITNEYADIVLKKGRNGGRCGGTCNEVVQMGASVRRIPWPARDT